MTKTLIISFDFTKVIKVVENTKNRFEAELSDSLGRYLAIVERVSRNKVSISFEGACSGRVLHKAFAKWEYEYIWKNLWEQGVKVVVLG